MWFSYCVLYLCMLNLGCASSVCYLGACYFGACCLCVSFLVLLVCVSPCLWWITTNKGESIYPHCTLSMLLHPVTHIQCSYGYYAKYPAHYWLCPATYQLWNKYSVLAYYKIATYTVPDRQLSEVTKWVEFILTSRCTHCQTPPRAQKPYSWSHSLRYPISVMKLPLK